MPCMGICPKELKTETQMDICTPMFRNSIIYKAKQ